MVQRVLVTGATGFVGQYLTSAIKAQWPKASLVGLCRNARPELDGDDFKAVDLIDFDETARIVRSFLPDVVVHLAAQSSANLDHAAAETWRINLGGSLSLGLAVAAYVPEATVLFASSAQVYGSSFEDSPVSEISASRPLNDYARSKVHAEKMFDDVLPKTARLIVARPFNHTGAGQRGDFALPSFAAQIARIESGLQPPHVMVGNLDVERDFLDVRDVVAAYIALIDARATLPHRLIVNVASGHPRKLGALLEELRSLASCPFAIDVDPSRARKADLPLAYARPELIRTLVGWEPRIAMSQTLSDLLLFARSQLTAHAGA